MNKIIPDDYVPHLNISSQKNFDISFENLLIYFDSLSEKTKTYTHIKCGKCNHIQKYKNGYYKCDDCGNDFGVRSTLANLMK